MVEAAYAFTVGDDMRESIDQSISRSVSGCRCCGACRDAEAKLLIHDPRATDAEHDGCSGCKKMQVTPYLARSPLLARAFESTFDVSRLCCSVLPA